MAHRGQAKLVRSLQAMTWGQIVAQENRNRQASAVEGGEMTQHVTVEISGKAGPKISRTELTVAFEHGFATRFEQGDTEVLDPVFAPGVVMHTDANVFVQPQVRDWVEDDSGFIVGARIRILHYAPGVFELTGFRASVHLQFAGWVTPMETGDDDVAGPVAGEAAPDTSISVVAPPSGGGGGFGGGIG